MEFKVGQWYKFKPGAVGTHSSQEEWYRHKFKFIKIRDDTRNYGYFTAEVNVCGYLKGYELSFNLSNLEPVKEPKTHLPIWF